VTCFWRDEYGASNTIKGVTHDISAGGLFIASRHWPWAGFSVVVDVQLPSRGQAHQCQLHGTGRVVRVVQDGDRSGFAIAGTACWNMARNRKQETVSCRL
jgi:hypothetical protein